MHPRLQTWRLPALLPKILLAVILMLPAMLAGCTTVRTIPIAVPCLNVKPEIPTVTMENLPADASTVDILRAALEDRERLIEFRDYAAVLLDGCASNAQTAP